VWPIYDYVDPANGNFMRSWSLALQKEQRARLNQKIDALSMHGLSLIPGVVAPTGVAAIFKLRVRGSVQLRPLFCEGPLPGESAFTFLLGAKEVSFEYVPKNAPETASKLRELLIGNPRRRCLHERVG
jgi:hypothetical protein